MPNGLEKTKVSNILQGWLEDAGVKFDDIDKNKDKSADAAEIVTSVLQHFKKYSEQWKKEIPDPKAFSKELIGQGEVFDKAAQQLADEGKKPESQEHRLYAQRTYRLAVQLDAENPTARLKLAESLYQNSDPKLNAKNMKEARLHWKAALALETDPRALVSIALLIEKYDKTEIPDGWSQVGGSLVASGKFKEAKEVFLAGMNRNYAIAGAARDMGDEAQAKRYQSLGDRYLEKSQVVDEKLGPPFVISISSKETRTFALLKALRAEGLPLSALVDPPHREVTAERVRSYLEQGIKNDDARALKALVGAKGVIPNEWIANGRIKPSVLQRIIKNGLGPTLADAYGDAAKSLGAGKKGHVSEKAFDLMLAAVEFDGNNASRYESLRKVDTVAKNFRLLEHVLHYQESATAGKASGSDFLSTAFYTPDDQWEKSCQSLPWPEVEIILNKKLALAEHLSGSDARDLWKQIQGLTDQVKDKSAPSFVAISAKLQMAVAEGYGDGYRTAPANKSTKDAEISRKAYESALGYLEQVLAKNPDDLSALTMRAKCHFQLENFKAALADVQRVGQLSKGAAVFPEAFDENLLKGQVRSKLRNDFQKELANYKRFLNADTDDEKTVAKASQARLEDLSGELRGIKDVMTAGYSDADGLKIYSFEQRAADLTLLHDFQVQRLNFLKASTAVAYEGASVPIKVDPYKLGYEFVKKGVTDLQMQIKDPKAYLKTKLDDETASKLKAAKEVTAQKYKEALGKEYSEHAGAYAQEMFGLELEMRLLKGFAEAQNRVVEDYEARRDQISDAKALMAFLDANPAPANLSRLEKISNAQAVYRLDKELGDVEHMAVSLKKYQALASGNQEYFSENPKERMEIYQEIAKGLDWLDRHYQVVEKETQYEKDAYAAIGAKRSDIRNQKYDLFFGENGIEATGKVYFNSKGLKWDDAIYKKLFNASFDYFNANRERFADYLSGEGMEAYFKQSIQADELMRQARQAGGLDSTDGAASRELAIQALGLYGELGDTANVKETVQFIQENLETLQYSDRGEDSGKVGGKNNDKPFNAVALQTYQQMADALKGSGIAARDEQADQKREEGWAAWESGKEGSDRGRLFIEALHASKMSNLSYEQVMLENARGYARSLAGGDRFYLNASEVQGAVAARSFYERNGDLDAVREIDKKLKDGFWDLEASVRFFAENTTPDLRPQFQNLDEKREWQKINGDSDAQDVLRRQGRIEEANNLLESKLALLGSIDLSKDEEKVRLGRDLSNYLDYYRMAIEKNPDLPVDFRMKHVQHLAVLTASFKETFGKGDKPVLSKEILDGKYKAVADLADQIFEQNSHAFLADLSPDLWYIVDKTNEHGLSAQLKSGILGYYSDRSKQDPNVRDAEITDKDWVAIEKIQRDNRYSPTLQDSLIQNYLVGEGKFRELDSGEELRQTRSLNDAKYLFRKAVTKGDVQTLLSFDLVAMRQLSQASDQAYQALDTANNPNLNLNLRLEQYIVAAGKFGELGLDNNVKTSLAFVERHIESIQDPTTRASGYFSLAQAYETAGMEKEAKAYLQMISDMDPSLQVAQFLKTLVGLEDAKPSGTDKTLHELAVFARGKIHMIGDDRDMDQAKFYFSQISDNKLAKAYLERIEDIQYQRRVGYPKEFIQGIFNTEVEKLRGTSREFEYYVDGKQTKADDFMRDSQAFMHQLDTLLASRECGSVDEALQRMRLDYKYNDLFEILDKTGRGNDTMAYVKSLANPALTDAQMAGETLRLAEKLMDRNDFDHSMEISSLLVNDPFIGKQAKEMIKTRIPESAKEHARWQAVKEFFKDLLIIPLIAEGRYKEAGFSALVTLLTLGTGTLFKTGAKAGWAAWEIRSIAVGGRLARIAAWSPRLFRFARFASIALADNVGFVLGGMAGDTLKTGENQFSGQRFIDELLGNLVTFGLVHATSAGISKLARRAEMLPWAKAADAEASALRAQGKNALRVPVRVGLWVTERVGMSTSIAVGGKISETIGIHEESNVPWSLRFLESLKMDLVFSTAGRAMNTASGGKIARFEQKTDHQSAMFPLLAELSLGGSKVMSETHRAHMAAVLATLHAEMSEKNGKPLGMAEFGKKIKSYNQSAKEMLESFGISGGELYDVGRIALIAMARDKFADPAKMAEYAKRIPDPAKFEKAFQAVLPEGVFNKEEQTQLRLKLLINVIERSGDGEQFRRTLEQFTVHAPEISTEMRRGMTAMLGADAINSPRGKQLFENFLATGFAAAETPGELPMVFRDLSRHLQAASHRIDAILERTETNDPKARLAIVDWYFKNSQDFQSLHQLLFTEWAEGKVDFQFKDGVFEAIRVAPDAVAARAKSRESSADSLGETKKHFAVKDQLMMLRDSEAYTAALKRGREILGLPAEGDLTASQVKTALRKLAKEVHSDIAGKNTGDRMIEAEILKTILMDHLGDAPNFADAIKIVDYLEGRIKVSDAKTSQSAPFVPAPTAMAARGRLGAGGQDRSSLPATPHEKDVRSLAEAKKKLASLQAELANAGDDATKGKIKESIAAAEKQIGELNQKATARVSADVRDELKQAKEPLNSADRAALVTGTANRLLELGIAANADAAKVVAEKLVAVAELGYKIGVVDGKDGISGKELDHLLTTLILKNALPVTSDARLQDIVNQAAKASNNAERRQILLKGLLQRETSVPANATGKAKFVDFGVLMAESNRVAAADEAMNQPWAKEAIAEVQKEVVMTDNNFFRREKYLRIFDHHGPYGNEASGLFGADKNSTMKMLGAFEDALRQVGGEAALANPSESQVNAAIKLLNIREASTDNLGDGGWTLWIAQNQARILKEPALRKLISEATYFEDFSAFGDGFDVNHPAVKLQLALFERYNQMVQKFGIKTMDRLSDLPADVRIKAMEEVVQAIDQILPKPGSGDLPADTVAAAERTWKMIESEGVAAAKAAKMDSASVDGKMVTVDLDKMSAEKNNDGTEKFPIFSRWLSVPRSHDLALQATVARKNVDNGVQRSEILVARPHGRELPSGKDLTAVGQMLQAYENFAAKERGVKPAFWIAKPNVLFPVNGSILTPDEVSRLLTDPASVQKMIEAKTGEKFPIADLFEAGKAPKPPAQTPPPSSPPPDSPPNATPEPIGPKEVKSFFSSKTGMVMEASTDLEETKIGNKRAVEVKTQVIAPDGAQAEKTANELKEWLQKNGYPEVQVQLMGTEMTSYYPGRKVGENGYWIAASGTLPDGGRKVVSVRIFFTEAPRHSAKEAHRAHAEIQDMVKVGHSVFYELALKYEKALSDLKKDSPEYFKALETYLKERDAISSKIVGEHVPEIKDAELAKILGDLMLNQVKKTSAISFLSPDDDHLHRVAASTKNLLKNPTLREGLEKQFGKNYEKVLAMAVLLSKVGFGHADLNPADHKSYTKNRLFALQMVDEMKPKLTKELGLDEAQFQAFREAILREGTFGLGTGETRGKIDMAITEADKLGLEIRDAFFQGKGIKAKYENALTAILTLASEVDVSQSRLQPWQTNETLMKALVSISSDPLIQELYLEKTSISLKLSAMTEPQRRAFQPELENFEKRFNDHLKTVIDREILAKKGEFTKKLAAELRLKGMDQPKAEAESKHLFGIIQANMKAINSDSYLWFLGSYGIKDIQINEKGEVVIITPEDLFATMGSAANLPHVRDFHVDRLTAIVSQVNQQAGTDLTLREEVSRKDPALYDAAHKGPKADTHTHLKMSVDFDLYIWNGIILSTDMKTNEKFLNELAKSDQNLTGLFVERQKKHGAPTDAQKNAEIFELNKIFSIARDTTTSLFAFVEAQRAARNEAPRSYDEIKNKDKIVEDARTELNRLEKELDARIKKDGHSAEIDQLRAEYEAVGKKIHLFHHLKFFVQNAFNFQEGPLTEFVPHFMAASRLLNISEADKVGTLKRITKEAISNYQKDNVTYFEPRFNIGPQAETQGEVVTVIQSYKEWIAEQKKANPNAMIPEMKIILSITKFADQKKPYQDREEHKTDSMQSFVNMLEEARRGVASGDQPYPGTDVKPSEFLKYLAGIDSAGQEEFNPPSMYFPAFRLIENYNAAVRAEGHPELAVGMTFHVSESNTDVSTESALRHTMDAIYMKPFGEVGPDTQPLMSRLGHSIVPGISDFSSLKGTQATERVAERLRQIDFDLKMLSLGVPLQSVTKEGLEKERDTLKAKHPTVQDQETADVKLPAYDDKRIADLNLRAAFIRDEMIRQNIVIETNPTSNLGISPYITGYQNHTSKTYLSYQYGAWARDIVQQYQGKTLLPNEQKAFDAAVAYLAKPEAKQFEGQHVRITINTDDLTLFGTNMTEEFYRIAVSLGLTIDQLKTLIEEGHKAPIRPEARPAKSGVNPQPSPKPVDPNRTQPLAQADPNRTQPLGNNQAGNATQPIGNVTVPNVEVSSLPPPPEMPSGEIKPKPAEEPAFMATGWYEKVGVKLEPGQSTILNSDKLGLTAGGSNAWEFQLVCRAGDDGGKVYALYSLSGNITLSGSKEPLDPKRGLSLEYQTRLQMGALEWSFGLPNSGQGLRLQYALDKALVEDQVNYYAGGPARTTLDRLAALDPKALADPNEPNISLQEKNTRSEMLQWQQEATSFKSKYEAYAQRLAKFSADMDTYRDQMIKDPKNQALIPQRAEREKEWRQLQNDWKELEKTWYYQHESQYEQTIQTVDQHLASVYAVIGYDKVSYPAADAIGNAQIAALNSGAVKTTHFGSIELNAVNLRNATDLLSRLNNHKGVNFSTKTQITSGQNMALRWLQIAPDGKTATAQIRVSQNGYTHVMAVKINFRDAVTEGAQAQAGGDQPGMAVAASPKKSIPEAERTNAKGPAMAKPPATERPADYFESVIENVSGTKLRGGLLALSDGTSEIPGTSIYKITAIHGDEITLGEGQRFAKGTGSEKIPGETKVKLKNDHQFKLGETVQFIPPLAGGSGEADSKSKSPAWVPGVLEADGRATSGSFLVRMSLKPGQKWEDVAYLTAYNEMSVTNIDLKTGKITLKRQGGKDPVVFRFDPTEPPAFVKELKLGDITAVMNGGGGSAWKAPFKTITGWIKSADPKKIFEEASNDPSDANRAVAGQKLIELAQKSPEKFDEALIDQLLLRGTAGELWIAQVIEPLLQAEAANPKGPHTVTQKLSLGVNHTDPRVQQHAFHFLLQMDSPVATALLKDGFETAVMYQHQAEVVARKGVQLYRENSNQEAAERAEIVKGMRLAFNMRALNASSKGQFTMYGNTTHIDVMVDRNTGLIERSANSTDRPDAKLFKMMVGVKLTDHTIFTVDVDPGVKRETFEPMIGKYIDDYKKWGIPTVPVDSASQAQVSAAQPVAAVPRGTLVVDLAAESGTITFGRGKAGPGRVHFPSREISRDHVKIGVGEQNGVNGVYVTSLVPNNHFNGESYGVYVEGESGWSKKPIKAGEAIFVPAGRRIGLGIIHPKTEGDAATKDAIVLEADAQGKIYTESQFIDQAAPPRAAVDIAPDRTVPEDMPTTVMPISIQQAYAVAARPSGIDPVVRPVGQPAPSPSDHLAALKRNGMPTNATDERNLILFGGSEFKAVTAKLDTDQTHTWIYALVDVRNGAISKFSRPEDTQQPVEGMAAIPIAIQNSNGKLFVNSDSLADVGLSPTAAQRMSNLNGFYTR